MDPHKERTKTILREYPHIKKLFGNTPSTSLFVFLSVGIQIGIAYLLREQPVWVLLIVAYLVGAFVNHGIWALVHELTHDLVFAKPFLNKTFLLIANFPLVFPSTIAFRKYHIFHHRLQGDVNFDADLPADFEKRFVGKSGFRKGIWLLFYFVFQTIRINYVKQIKLWDRWVAANGIVQVLFLAVLFYFLGWASLLYLVFSAAFSIGLHPVGARWIQEHYLVKPDQETYSYYGPLNYLSYNVGYHNEHHDFMTVPWTRLKQVRKVAAPHYDNLYFHTSWTALLWRFLTDPELNLHSRRTR